MNKFFLSNILMLMPLILLADNGACQPPQMPDGRPEPSYARIKDEPPVDFFQSQPSSKPQHEHRLNFGLVNLGYERILPNSTYIGADMKFTPFYTVDGDNKNAFNYFINGELRMGYNHAFNKQNTIIPYAGMGFSVFKFEKKEGKIRDWNYATIGAKYLHQFGEIFEMGLHIKAYRSIQETKHSIVKVKKPKSVERVIINEQPKLQDKQGNKLIIVEGKLQLEKESASNPPVAKPVIEVAKPAPVSPKQITEALHSETISFKDASWMMEFSIPFIWHLGETKNWEIQVEPYYMQIPNGKRLHLLGSRLSFGFRF